MKNKEAIVITGQTATGKTKLAIELARKENGEIVNADSRQLYKHLDIITGKDLADLQLSGIPYHTFDIADPAERVSSHMYVEAARPVIEVIRSRGKTPIIVGGSYLYIKHLLYGFDTCAPPDESLREELEQKSLEELQRMLSPKPADINSSDWNNPRRLIRRIEILRSSAKKRPSREPIFRPVGGYGRHDSASEISLIGLRHQDRESLEKAVKLRVEKRLEDGAVEEVAELLRKGYTENDPGMKTIGYQQILKYLIGEYSKDQAIKIWTTREIQYAKRQYTFIKMDKNIVWSLVK